MENTKKTYIIAVDSGGTFTDCVVMDNEGVITTGKSDSTPEDFSIGVLNSLETVTESLGLPIEGVLEQTEE